MAASWSVSLAVYCVARTGPKPCSMSFQVFIVDFCSFRLLLVCSCVRWLRVVSRARGRFTLCARFPVRHGIMGAIGA